MTVLALGSATLACLALGHLLPTARMTWRGIVLVAIALLVQQPGWGGYLQGALALGFPFLLLTLASRKIPSRLIAPPLLAGAALASTSLISASPTLSLIKGIAWASLFILVALSLSEREALSGEWTIARGGAESAARLLGAVIPLFFMVALLASLLIGHGFLVPETTGIPQLTPTLLGMHPNTFAFYLVLGVLTLVWSREDLWTLRDLLGFIALAALVLMTRSRTALVLVAIGLLIMMMTRGGRRARWAGGLLLICVAVAVALEVVPLEFLMRGQGESEVAQLSGRLPLWDAALAGVRERPWLGWGFGVGPEIAIERHATTYLAYSVSTSDNMFLDVALAGGMVLLAAWVLLILGMVARMVAASRSKSNWSGLLVACAFVVLVRSTLGSGFDVLGPVALAFQLTWLGVSAAASETARASESLGRRVA